MPALPTENQLEHPAVENTLPGRHRLQHFDVGHPAPHGRISRAIGRARQQEINAAGYSQSRSQFGLNSHRFTLISLTSNFAIDRLPVTVSLAFQNPRSGIPASGPKGETMKLHLKVLLCLSVLGPGLFAQSVATSQIAGTVQDATGLAIPGAEVKITQTETGATRTAQSAADGGYVLPQPADRPLPD